jgi:hypothetical protein
MSGNINFAQTRRNPLRWRVRQHRHSALALGLLRTNFRWGHDVQLADSKLSMLIDNFVTQRYDNLVTTA